jgi:uncharacterized membrane protein
MDLTIVTSSRVLHVLGAIVLFGGAVFIRCLLIPAAKNLPENERTLLHDQVARYWRQVVGIASGVLILSGLYNYVIVARPQHQGDSLYHALMGTKILLAAVVFFLASVLPGRARVFEFFRRRNAFWLTFNILLATCIVAIAGFLKVRGIPG